jgi:hypothetical protein
MWGTFGIIGSILWSLSSDTLTTVKAPHIAFSLQDVAFPRSTQSLSETRAFVFCRATSPHRIPAMGSARLAARHSAL